MRYSNLKCKESAMAARIRNCRNEDVVVALICCSCRAVMIVQRCGELGGSHGGRPYSAACCRPESAATAHCWRSVGHHCGPIRADHHVQYAVWRQLGESLQLTRYKERIH